MNTITSTFIDRCTNIEESRAYIPSFVGKLSIMSYWLDVDETTSYLWILTCY